MKTAEVSPLNRLKNGHLHFRTTKSLYPTFPPHLQRKLVHPSNWSCELTQRPPCDHNPTVWLAKLPDIVKVMTSPNVTFVREMHSEAPCDIVQARWGYLIGKIIYRKVHDVDEFNLQHLEDERGVDVRRILSCTLLANSIVYTPYTQVCVMWYFLYAC